MNKIICGDCIEEMKKIPNKSIDFVFSDYPFNCQDGRKDYCDFIAMTTDAFYRILKNDCPLLVINNPANIFKTNRCFSKFKHRDSIALIRRGALRPAWHFGFQHNYLLTFIKGDDVRLKWNGTKLNHDKQFPTDVMEYQNGFRGNGNAWHPQAVPLKFTKKFIEIFTNEGDVVLDPFLGSGTTAVACKELNRKYIGIEINPKYCKIAECRLKQYELFK